MPCILKPGLYTLGPDQGLKSLSSSHDSGGSEHGEVVGINGAEISFGANKLEGI